MTRRFDTSTAEKVSLALLTRAAFGRFAGLRYAKLAGLSAILITEIFARKPDKVRRDVVSVIHVKDRRITSRA